MSAPGEQGRRLALIVAGSEYRDPTLQQLRSPGEDACDLAGILGDPEIGGFHVRTLIDTPSDQLLREIAGFCGDVGPSDLLLVYLSCHGVLDPRNRLYYATVDTERRLLAATAMSAHWLNDQLDDCRAHRKIFLLDCCHSGAFAKGAKGDDALALHDRFDGRGKVVLTASRASEYSFEAAGVVGDRIRSVFTRAVVDGLRTGDADRDKDGLITVTELYQHVYDVVRRAESRQTPELWTYGAEGDLLVAHSPRGAIVEPIPLPEDLRLTLESPRLVVRLSGVKALAELVQHGEPGLVVAAKQMLQRISDEDHPRVAALAGAALDADWGQVATQVRPRKPDGQKVEEDAQRDAAEQTQEQATELPNMKISPQTIQVGQWVDSMSIAPGARRLATGTRGRILMWDFNSGKLLWQQTACGRLNSVCDVAFNCDGTRLATASRDKTARIWDVGTGSPLFEVRHSSRVSGVAFSPDGRRLAIAGFGVQICDAATGEPQLQDLISPGIEVNAAVFSPDGSRLATGSRDKTARIWDTATGKQLLSIRVGHRVTAVAFTPDGTRLATASDHVDAIIDEKSLLMWDASTGEQQLQLTPAGYVRAVVFNPDGTLLATGNSSGAYVWDTTTGVQLLDLYCKDIVEAVAFTPGGTRLAIGGHFKAVRIFDIQAASEQSRWDAEHRARQRLS